MVFSSPIFLFGFLPLTLLIYYLSPGKIKNLSLLVCSLLFYAWGEVFYLGVMLVSILSNYIFGLLIHREETGHQQSSKGYLFAGIGINIAILISFKYANFITENINLLLSVLDVNPIDLQPVHLPLGISFFTFQAISYLVDVYKMQVPAQRNCLDLALYISLFPQLIAGPIVRYHDISSQIKNRAHSIEDFACGTKRFVYGLAKKMLVANALGEVADSVFSLEGHDLTMPLAWIGILCYTLQIYFDFSGYSDMAIGLGRMFGFRLLENFNYPYVSKSIREFWRRWHISLSTWFRDYVYIALGGNRVSAVRVYLNLLIVFILTGFWHGASWNFLIWGLFHGLFLASEHAGFSRMLKKVWGPLQHTYTLLVVVVGWVFFRSDTLAQAVGHLTSMVDIFNFGTTSYQFAQVLSYEAFFAFSIGILLSSPLYPSLKRYLETVSCGNAVRTALYLDLPRVAVLSFLLLLSILKVAASTYNPFIYFRF